MRVPLCNPTKNACDCQHCKTNPSHGICTPILTEEYSLLGVRQNLLYRFNQPRDVRHSRLGCRLPAMIAQGLTGDGADGDGSNSGEGKGDSGGAASGGEMRDG